MAGADFGSVNDDMSVVNCLYGLAVDAVRPVLAELGFCEDSDGLLAWFALAKAVAASAITVETKLLQPYRAMLEEALTGWWHAGVGRFEFRSLRAGSDDATGGTVLVVCSSLGTGIVRPEWVGTLRQLALDAASPGRVDVLHVIDPSSTWWMQDPGCNWDGFSYYQREVSARVAGYDRVLVLGDSMGGGARLSLSLSLSLSRARARSRCLAVSLSRCLPPSLLSSLSLSLAALFGQCACESEGPNLCRWSADASASRTSSVVLYPTA